MKSIFILLFCIVVSLQTVNARPNVDGFRIMLDGKKYDSLFMSCRFYDGSKWLKATSGDHSCWTFEIPDSVSSQLDSFVLMPQHNDTLVHFLFSNF